MVVKNECLGGKEGLFINFIVTGKCFDCDEVERYC